MMGGREGRMWGVGGVGEYRSWGTEREREGERSKTELQGRGEEK